MSVEFPLLLNLTAFTPEKVGIFTNLFEPSQEERERIDQLTTFEELPTKALIFERAKELVNICMNQKPQNYSFFCKVLIAGIPPFLIPALQELLIKHGFSPTYPFPNIENPKKVYSVEVFDDFEF